MATRRRKMTSRPRRKGDWVYRSNARVLGTGVINNDLLGSYEAVVTTVNSGIANAQTRILYDSKNYMGWLTRAGIGTAPTVATTGILGGHARAEGRKPCILAVDGVILCDPTTWALGNVMALGVRVGVFEQDISGVLSLDAGFTMWESGAGIFDGPAAAWANNTRANCRDIRQWQFYSDGAANPNMVVRVKWRGRRYLEGWECFAMFLQVPTTSVNMRTQCWVRTLVSDEG